MDERADVLLRNAEEEYRAMEQLSPRSLRDPVVWDSQSKLWGRITVLRELVRS